jgi:ribosomal protein L36
VRIAIALKTHGECKFVKRNGNLTKARDCDKPKFFKARLGEIRNGKVPWTFRIRHLDLPNGRYIAEALGTDRQNNNETKLRRFNRKHFRLR